MGRSGTRHSKTGVVCGQNKKTSRAAQSAIIQDGEPNPALYGNLRAGAGDADRIDVDFRRQSQIFLDCGHLYCGFGYHARGAQDYDVYAGFAQPATAGHAGGCGGGEKRGVIRGVVAKKRLWSRHDDGDVGGGPC